MIQKLFNHDYSNMYLVYAKRGKYTAGQTLDFITDP